MTGSLPLWERGLKLLYLFLVVSLIVVAPLVGAWIEMRSDSVFDARI